MRDDPSALTFAHIPPRLLDRYEFISYGHAAELLGTSFRDEWEDILTSLDRFSLTIEDITKGGGNESDIPKKFDAVLYPRGWREIRISGDLAVKLFPRQRGQRAIPKEPAEIVTLTGYIDGHNIDFIKGRVAFDLEWNSKDQTFDRDILAMRTYFECGLIDVGIIVTRAEDLNEIFRALGPAVKSKYGASTTWLGKLTYRLDSRRQGGCPIMCVGIRQGCVTRLPIQATDTDENSQKTEMGQTGHEGQEGRHEEGRKEREDG